MERMNPTPTYFFLPSSRLTSLRFRHGVRFWDVTWEWADAFRSALTQWWVIYPFCSGQMILGKVMVVEYQKLAFCCTFLQNSVSTLIGLILSPSTSYSSFLGPSCSDLTGNHPVKQANVKGKSYRLSVAIEETEQLRILIPLSKISK